MSCWSLCETGSAALGPFTELVWADEPVCISECSTELPKANHWWRLSLALPSKTSDFPFNAVGLDWDRGASFILSCGGLE